MGAQTSPSDARRGNWRRLHMLIALLTALVLVLAACGGDDGDDEDDGNGGAPADEEEAPEDEDGDEAAGEDLEFDLAYGLLMPLTGDLSPFGPANEAGAQLAIELAEEALESTGQDGVTLSSVTEDSQTDSPAAVEGATKLVQTDNVNVIVGALASDNTIPVAESVTIPEQVVQISPASTSPAITDLADDGYVWRTPPSDALQSLVLAESIAEELGGDATLNVGARNDAYGSALAEAFVEAWEDQGGTVGEQVLWDPDAATFDTEAGQLAGGEPDGWMIVDFPETWDQMGPALVRTGNWDPARSFLTDGLAEAELPQTAGEEATESARGTRPTAVGEVADAFNEVWDERVTDVERTTFDAQSFDAAMVAFLAAVAATSSDSADIADNLQSVSGAPGDTYTFEDLDAAIEALIAGEDIDYEGVSGPVDFDDNGDITASAYDIWMFQDGQVEVLDTIEFTAEDE